MTTLREKPEMPERRLFGLYTAVVIDNVDPQGEARVLIRLPVWGERGERDAAWARVSTLDAGNNAGTWFMPEIGDEVVVAFLGGDARQPVVLGALWNGQAQPPESIAADNPKRMIKTRAGSSLTLDDTFGEETIHLETAGGTAVTLSDATDGGVTLRTDTGTRIQIGPTGVTITADGTVRVQSANVAVTTGMVTVDAGMSSFSGVVQCDTLIATSVVASSYTPGAGNIW
jgi:uncharacterized protein involved in type VI secretion and phage assembly